MKLHKKTRLALREIALFGMLGAMTFAAKVAMAGLPNIEPVSLMVMLSMCAGAMAAGVTLRTFTPFADVDFAAQGYMDMITAWEEETGNVVEDYSGVMDESWMQTLRSMLASGEADVVVLPVGSGLTVNELVSAPELAAAAPQIGVKKFSAMKESDGSMLLSPMRLYWEALYVNTDVLERYGLSVPQTYSRLPQWCFFRYRAVACEEVIKSSSTASMPSFFSFLM